MLRSNTSKMTTLNSSQIEILKLFNNHNTEEDLKELKKVLIAYLSKKVVTEADKNTNTNETPIDWQNEHFRRKQL